MRDARQVPEIFTHQAQAHARIRLRSGTAVIVVSAVCRRLRSSEVLCVLLGVKFSGGGELPPNLVLF